MDVLTRPKEVPGYLELILLLTVVDVKHAFSRWANEDRGRLFLIPKVIIYWWLRTPVAYIMAMTWKANMIAKITWGLWDAAAIRALQNQYPKVRRHYFSHRFSFSFMQSSVERGQMLLLYLSIPSRRNRSHMAP